MRIIHRTEQGQQPTAKAALTDSIFDGEAIPREITPRDWLREGDVHRTKVLTTTLDTTRYLQGPQVSITRDDIRRTTWAAVVEDYRLMLCEVSGPRPHQFPAPRLDRTVIAEGDIWRYHLALDKFSGKVSVAWVVRTDRGRRLWLNGREVDTASSDVDFPFLAFSQVAVGRVAIEAPRFAILTYKCRSTGNVFIRRLQNNEIGPETPLAVGETIGGASIGIAQDRVLIRCDSLQDGKLIPTLLESADGGKSFGKPTAIDLSGYDKGFQVVPGYTAPTVDKGYGLHVPVFMSNGEESVALNYVTAGDVLVEAIRVRGARPKGGLEVFPSTVGSRNTHGDGISDGHGLIMVLGTEGRLYSSNSSAGGIHFPDSALLNHEMPQVAAFDASECYSSGLRANYVSMDYLYVELDIEGRVVSPFLHIETWDMPLPVPQAKAEARGSEVVLAVLKDADLEPGKVVFGINDPSISITEARIENLRSAVISTNSKNLIGKRVSYDVHTLFHRHYGEAVIEKGR